MQYAPCKNPQCKKHGQSHPNCNCYNETSPSELAKRGLTAPGTTRGMTKINGSFQPREPYVGGYAKGGEIHFCSEERAHEPHCEYFAGGGKVSAPMDGGENDDTAATIGHVAIQHGLSGLLGGAVGDPLMKGADEHAHIIDEAKAQHKHRLLGESFDGKPETAPKESIGTQLGDAAFEGKPEDAANALQSHALVGGLGKKVLTPILGRLSKPILEQPTNPTALRGAVDYLGDAANGGARLDDGVSGIMGHPKHATQMQLMSREASRKDLKEKLESAKVNPEELLSTSGSLSHYLPQHAGQVGATVATATNYLDALKPKNSQKSPLDEVTQADPLAEWKYNRQLDIANHPLIVLEHIKDGTLQSEDLTTLKTIYPGFLKALTTKVGEEIISAKAGGTHIPYNQRMALSLILGQPLDSTMTSSSMMAIISSQQEPQMPPKGPSGQTQKTIEKANDTYKTPLDRLQTPKK